MQISDTIAAIATPPGEGGIAIIRVSGPIAREIGGRLFSPRRANDPAAYLGYTVHYGRFEDVETGETIDDGLLTVFRAPHSYTGEDSVELACHGGATTTARLLRCAIRAGARLAEPGEFTQRAFLNGRLDLAQAEAVADVIRARTEAAQRVARRQLDGALSTAVRRCRDELIGIMAAIEVTIDFSDEVGELEYAPLLTRITAVRDVVEGLLETAGRGRILRDGLRVALIGRPNVGKSSLFNALLRENRAIVTEIPGTTRDRLEETANLGGAPIVFIDAAGIRETDDLVERVGVERAESALRQSDIILFVLDACEGVTAGDREVAERMRMVSHVRTLIVLNKQDAASQEALIHIRKEAGTLLDAQAICAVSALDGAGLPDLERTLLNMALGSDSESAMAAESIVVSNVRHRAALESALRSLREAERTSEQRLPGDFIAIDARGALDALGLITGETVTDDIVHRIFRDFCVGK